MGLSILKNLTWQKIKSKSKDLAKSPIFWARFAGYTLPLVFLFYVLYLNFLPFGYHKTFTIDVGAPGDTSGEFYLEPSRDLSERKTAPDETTYRELNGSAQLILNTKKIPTKAKSTLHIEGDNIYIIPRYINFEASSISWNNNWDLTKKIPNDFKGNAFIFDDSLYFDGKSKLELQNSNDKFETGPFSVYVEWIPKDNTADFQQIVGHYNWELLQNSSSVTFQVGRMNYNTGPFYRIKFPIPTNFFNKKHAALANYSPAISSSNGDGYISLYIDNEFVGKVFIGKDVIWNEFNSKTNLSLGKSVYSEAKYFKGNIIKFNFSNFLSYKDCINECDITNIQTNQVQLTNSTTSRLAKIELIIKK